MTNVTTPTFRDAKALYKTLDELLNALDSVNVDGQIGDVEEYDTAKEEAETLLAALEGEYDR
jgi:hypothetical protein